MTTRTYPATHPGCLAGLEVTLADVTDPTDRYAPPTVTACPDCGTTEPNCFPPGCCDPCQERAHIHGPGRHLCTDLDGLNLAMHQRGYCKCGRAA